ncbi:MAG: hypothetical protein HYS34_01850 [Acidobacteria bacterium]|nr:hypothetical protein [Acidobacteriota bacterium]
MPLPSRSDPRAARTRGARALPPAAAVLFAAAVAAFPGCGKRGPPQPPLRVTPRPAQNVHVRQTGADVVIEAGLSMSRTDGTPLGPGASVRVLRMRATPTLRPGAVSLRYLMSVFRKEAKVIGTLSGASLQPAAAEGRLVFRDPGALPEARQTRLLRFLYGIQVMDGRGERSAFSAPVEIEVIEPPPPAVKLQAATAEGEVRLAWESGDPSRTGELYNVYRRPASEAGEPRVPLNIVPIAERSYVDTSFQYGETYRYSVRSLPAPPPPLRESAPGGETEVRPLDTYAPGAPTGLAATVEGALIKLYWFPNGEADLRGYRVYRRTGGGEFELVGEVGAAETSFADATAGKGVRYDYAVTAVDGAAPPNESPRSEAQSEALPADTEVPSEGAAPANAAPPGRPG